MRRQRELALILCTTCSRLIQTWSTRVLPWPKPETVWREGNELKGERAVTASTPVARVGHTDGFSLAHGMFHLVHENWRSLL